MFSRLINELLVGVLHLYQVFLSPIFGGNCRFYPSCSEYSKECFQKHGVFKSFWLTTVRLSKCHPLGPSGFDPVPEKKVSCYESKSTR